jgi:hypothetical protein
LYRINNVPRHSGQLPPYLAYTAVGLYVPRNLPQAVYLEYGNDEQILAAKRG